MPASLGTALSLAGAEQQPMTELGGHTVQELPQGLVAALLAAGLTLVGVLSAARSNVAEALPLAAAVEVASFDGIEAGVAVSLSVRTVETFWSHCEHT